MSYGYGGYGRYHHRHRGYGCYGPPSFFGGVTQDITQTQNIFNVGGTVNATQNAGQLATG